MLDIEREQDIERLRQVARLQKSQLEHLIAMLARKCAELEKLKGSGGELQIALKLLEEAQQEAAKLDAPTAPPAEKKTRKREQRGHGPTEQPNLPRVPLRCELGDKERECPACHGTLKPLVGQVERSEMIDVVELKYQVVEVERQKYVCACGGAVETAPGPARAVEGGRYSLRFAIKVAFDKYVAHLPLERQARLMAHHGLNITSQTLWDQCSAITDLLEPTYDALFALLRASPVVGVDQTGWPDLEDSSLPPWQMWCVTAPGIVYHRICDDKSARTFKTLLGDYQGWVVADALGTHQAGARECSGLRLAGCWAHVLRRFRDAVVDFPEAQFMLAWIQDLYEIDARATDVAERKRLRATESRAVTEKMKVWMQGTTALKSTSLGGAIRYTVGIWDRLTLFLADGEVWLDNNRTERGLRGPVVGRRNHFGSKSARGTQVAAIMYSLVESAKVCGIDPIAYLTAVAMRAQRSPGAVLLPADFGASTAAAA
ncbi:MAG TPA: IS66 family transposase [Myxococcales bacterium]|nr:IS66 family transposase [Myxococcales bacterium]